MNGDVKTKIIKRNGEEVTFDLNKIIREGCRSGSKFFSCGECRRHPEYGRDRDHGDERI